MGYRVTEEKSSPSVNMLLVNLWSETRFSFLLNSQRRPPRRLRSKKRKRGSRRMAFKHFINEKIYLSHMSRLKDSMCSRQLRQNSTLWDKIQQYCEVSLKLFLIFPILQRGKMLESKCTKSYFFAQWKLDLITITKSLNQRFSQRRSEGSLSYFEKKPWLRLVTWLPKSGGQK